ncbi:MAG: hypothetical protein Ta2E_04510 [Mycoplasmoidaceae bacterium]|nr:MAG: hypothetical protein Ta2E_04510 [Mycoplasmoidaceae bacterium]
MKKIINYFKIKFWTWNLLCLTVFSAASIVIVTTSNKNKNLNDFQNSPLAAEDIIFDIDNASDDEIMKHNTSIENNLINEFNDIGLDSELVSNISDDSTLSEAEKYLKLNELAAINDVNIIDKEQFSTLLPKLENVEIQNMDNLDDTTTAQAKNKIHSVTSNLSQTLHNQEINTIDDLRTYSDSIILSNINNNFDEENLALSYTLLSQYCNQFINSSKLSINDNVTICWDELFNEDNINQYVGVGYSVDVTEFLSDILLFNNLPLSSDLDVYLDSDSTLYGRGLQLSLSIDAFVNDLDANLYLQKQKSNYFDYTFDVSFSIIPPYEIIEQVSSSDYEWNITNKEYDTFELQPTEVYDNKNSLKLFDIVKEQLVINNSFNISELENDGYGYSQGQEELRWYLYRDYPEVSYTWVIPGCSRHLHTQKVIVSKAWTETKICTINDTELSEMKEFIEHGWYAKVYRNDILQLLGLPKTNLLFRATEQESIDYVTNGGYIVTIKNNNVNSIKNNVALSSYPTFVNIKDENDELKAYEELIPNHHISLKLLKKREATSLTNNQFSVDYKFSITNDLTNYTTDVQQNMNTGGMSSDRDQQIVDQYVEVMFNEFNDLIIDLGDEIQKNQLIFDNKDELKKLKDKYIYDTSVERALIITEIAVNVLSSALTWITMGASVIDVIFSATSLAFDTIGILKANEDIRNINGLLDEYLSSDKIKQQNQLISLSDNLHSVQKNKYDAIVFCNNLNNDMTKYINLINSNAHKSNDFIDFKLDAAKAINYSSNTSNEDCLAIGNIKNTYKKFHNSLGIITLYSSSIHIANNEISDFVNDAFKFYDDNQWGKVIISGVLSITKISSHYKLFKEVLKNLNLFNTMSKIDDVFSYSGKNFHSWRKRYGGMIRSVEITTSKIKTLKNLNLIADISFGVLSVALNIALGIFKYKKESTYKEINKIII